MFMAFLCQNFKIKQKLKNNNFVMCLIGLMAIIGQFHKFFMFHLFEWCSSYIYMAVSLWICLGFITYFTIVMLLKVIVCYKNRKEIVDKICSIVENDDPVGCVHYLNRYPQCVNAFAKNGYTPFLVACANGNTQLVKLMLKRGADVRLKSKYEESAFYLGTFFYIKHPQNKNATCIQELYYAGANVDEPNKKGLTPLQMAAMFGHTPLVKWLLNKNANRNVIPDPYLIARSQGHQDTADEIRKRARGFAIDFK